MQVLPFVLVFTKRICLGLDPEHSCGWGLAVVVQSLSS